MHKCVNVWDFPFKRVWSSDLHATFISFTTTEILIIAIYFSIHIHQKVVVRWLVVTAMTDTNNSLFDK